MKSSLTLFADELLRYPGDVKRVKPLTSQRRVQAIEKLLETRSTTCHYCACVLKFEQITLDHVVPRALGGRNKLSNFVLACAECNNNRGIQVGVCWCINCLLAWYYHVQYLNSMK